MQTTTQNSLENREYYLRVARNYVRETSTVERVADYCMANPGSSVLHAVWSETGRRYDCICPACR